MKKTDVKKYLNSLTKEQINNIVLNLYDLSITNKEFIISKINPEYENLLLLDYQNIIENEFVLKNDDFSLDFNNIKKVIKQYKSISNIPKNVIELILFYVECGVNFTQEYGDIGEKYFKCISWGFKYYF